MEIILLQDVENLGVADTIVSVKPGYARNFLIPQGKALTANPANRNNLDHRIRVQEAADLKRSEEYKAIAETLTSSTLNIKVKAGTSGKIFGSVTSVQIVNAIREAHNLDIERKKVSLPEEVKNVGEYTALIALSKLVEAKVKFNVEAED